MPFFRSEAAVWHPVSGSICAQGERTRKGAVQDLEACRGGHSSPELGTHVQDCKAEANKVVQGGKQM